jgi:uncharacterized membrane protein YoaK (UPF0700 family)
VSVLGLGKVFTANMTGNIVFLGFAIAKTPGFSIVPTLAALLTFMLGAFIGGRTGQTYGKQPLRHWLTVAAAIETALLWLAAVVSFFFDPKGLGQDWALFSIIGLTAMAMGFRNATIRQLKVPDLTTTVLTLTITGIAADLHLAGGTGSNLPRKIAAIAAILVGAAVGALMVMRWVSRFRCLWPESSFWAEPSFVCAIPRRQCPGWRDTAPSIVVRPLPH